MTRFSSVFHLIENFTFSSVIVFAKILSSLPNLITSLKVINLLSQFVKYKSISHSKNSKIFLDSSCQFQIVRGIFRAASSYVGDFNGNPMHYAGRLPFDRFYYFFCESCFESWLFHRAIISEKGATALGNCSDSMLSTRNRFTSICPVPLWSSIFINYVTFDLTNMYVDTPFLFPFAINSHEC